MKILSLTLLLGCCLFLSELTAQGTCPPTDPAATVIDTVSVLVSISTPPGDSTSAVYKKKGNTGQIIWEMVLWNTSAGPAIEINPASIQFSGDSDAINNMSTMDILNLVAQTSIARAIVSGEIPCPTECGQSTIAVLFPSCVSRSGSGANTSIVACDGADCCTRLYAVCCPSGGGAPTIVPLPSSGPACDGASAPDGGPCTPTCN